MTAMKTILAINIFCLLFGLTNACSSAKTAGLEEESNSVSSASNAPEPSATSSMRIPRDEVWRGASGVYYILWAKKNIDARDKNKEVFSARKFALERLKTASNGELSFENYTFKYRVLNAVGSMLFLEETTSYSPQSYKNQIYTAIDLSNPTAKISLTNFFSEAEILDALNRYPLIADDLKSRKIAAPKTLKEFFAAFDREPTEGTTRKIDSCYFPENFLESFYFDRLEADKIAVNLGIPCRTGTREEEVSPLELLLPSKPAVEKDLKAVRFNYRLEAIDKEAAAVISFNAKSLKKSK